MYFKNFPKVLYSFGEDNSTKQILLTDITKNVRFLTKTLSSIELYDNYSIRDGETPDIISNKFYGTPYYNWIIMLANNKLDYINDFPRSQFQLDRYIQNKYGDEADDIAFFTKNGKIVDYGTVDAVGITNRVYENMLNESKRPIKLISKNLINVVLRDFNRLING